MYIVVKERIGVRGINDANRIKKSTFKNNVLYRSCISKINNTFVENAEDLDIVMRMYNLLEHSNNYSMTSGNLRNYYREKVNDSGNKNNGNNNKINNNKTATSKSFEYKTNIIGNIPYSSNILDAGSVVAPLKNLSKIWSSFDSPLINGKIELDLG